MGSLWIIDPITRLVRLKKKKEEKYAGYAFPFSILDAPSVAVT